MGPVGPARRERTGRRWAAAPGTGGPCKIWGDRCGTSVAAESPAKFARCAHTAEERPGGRLPVAARSGASWGILGILTVCRPRLRRASGDDEQRPYVASGMLTGSCPGAFPPVPEAMPSRGGSCPLPGAMSGPRPAARAPAIAPMAANEGQGGHTWRAGCYRGVPARSSGAMPSRGCSRPLPTLVPARFRMLHDREIPAQARALRMAGRPPAWGRRAPRWESVLVEGPSRPSEAPLRAPVLIAAKIGHMPADCPHGRHPWGTNHPPAPLTSGNHVARPRGHTPVACTVSGLRVEFSPNEAGWHREGAGGLPVLPLPRNRDHSTWGILGGPAGESGEPAETTARFREATAR